jgi:hypothetical protein
LENYDYRSVLMEQPSAAEQAIAVLLNVIEVDDAGLVGNAEYAEFRAGQCIRSYCDIDFEAAPPFEYWETERASYRWRSSGPMP